MSMTPGISGATPLLKNIPGGYKMENLKRVRHFIRQWKE
jgi:hypothetical protein